MNLPANPMPIKAFLHCHVLYRLQSTVNQWFLDFIVFSENDIFAKVYYSAHFQNFLCIKIVCFFANVCYFDTAHFLVATYETRRL